MTSPQLDLSPLLPRLQALPGPRSLIAVAGPPGAGKSTLSEALLKALHGIGESAAVVPMDGYHLDNTVLVAKGLLARKGAPETFDAAGFAALLRRITRGEHVYYPVFDRSRDISIAGAGELACDTRFVICEGNYLLCDTDPWRDFLPLWSMPLSIDPGFDEISRRLLQRWLDHGLPEPDARARRDSNDLPNARYVARHSVVADLTV